MPDISGGHSRKLWKVASMVLLTQKPTPRPSNLYCLPGDVNGRTTLPYEVNEALEWLRAFEREIAARIPDLSKKHQAYEQEIRREDRHHRFWAGLYQHAYYNQQDLPTVDLKNTVAYGNTSVMRGLQLPYWAVLEAGPDAVTVWELKQKYNRPSNSSSGGMSKLHRAGIVAKLDLKR